ncbi:MAG TPA: S4 domain-containing protein, partial [Elainellaceae cyanobacterium]
MGEHERLQKIISQWGFASRRQAEQMIVAGRVRVNGCIAELGQKADPAKDRIE